MGRILDSSAVLAVLQGEPGGEMVIAGLADSAISSVNVAEVFRVLMRKGSPSNQVKRSFARLWIPVIPFDAVAAELSGEIGQVAPQLSLGDCACIALARLEKASEVVTGDRAWAGLDLGVKVTLIR